jgi:hypothetical protein
MNTAPNIGTLLLIAALSLPTLAQLIVQHVYVGPNNQINVVYANCETAVVRAERGQIGAILMATDAHTAGWVVLYRDPDGGLANRRNNCALALWQGHSPIPHPTDILELGILCER